LEEESGGCPLMVVEVYDGKNEGVVVASTQLPLFPLDLIDKSNDEEDEGSSGSGHENVVWYPLIKGALKPGAPLKDYKVAGKIALEVM